MTKKNYNRKINVDKMMLDKMADKISEDLILRNHLLDRYNLFYYSSITNYNFFFFFL